MSWRLYCLDNLMKPDLITEVPGNENFSEIWDQSVEYFRKNNYEMHWVDIPEYICYNEYDYKKTSISKYRKPSFEPEEGQMVYLLCLFADEADFFLFKGDLNEYFTLRSKPLTSYFESSEFKSAGKKK